MVNKLNIANRVKSRRLELGLTQYELADLTGSAQASIQKVERGETKNPRNIEALAAALKCTPEYLRFGVSEGVNSDSNNVPLLNGEQVDAWLRGELSTAARLLCPIACSPEAFAVSARGISMEPKIFEGDLIFVEPKSKAQHGDYVYYTHDPLSEPKVRKLIIEGDKSFLQAENPHWPDAINLLNHEASIIGKVVFLGRNL